MTIETFHLARAKAWYAAGKNTIEIAVDQGCNQHTVWSRLKAAGVKMRPDGASLQRQRALERKLLSLLGAS